MALYLMVFMGGTPLGSPFIGWIGEQFGARWTLIGGGGLTILGVLALGRRLHPWTRHARAQGGRADEAPAGEAVGSTA